MVVDDYDADVDCDWRREEMKKLIECNRASALTHLHNKKASHVTDNLFSLLTVNIAIACWIVAAFFANEKCELPLRTFLVVEGCFAPFAAVLPVILRQWYYLHLRLNFLSCFILLMSMCYYGYFFVGQNMAFKASADTCDSNLSVATNAIVFAIYISLLVFTAKTVWYVIFRIRYTYKELLMSCIRDPYPNVDELDDYAILQLEEQCEEEIDSEKVRIELEAENLDYGDNDSLAFNEETLIGEVDELTAAMKSPARKFRLGLGSPSKTSPNELNTLPSGTATDLEYLKKITEKFNSRSNVMDRPY